MNTPHAQRSYEQRLNRVQAYVHEHLDEDLDLNRLADIACMSPSHWHRVYHGIYGETIAATVKRVRLHTASGLLANSTLSVEDIARRCGYPNVQSFTRIFAERYGMPPAQYRREGSHRPLQDALAAPGFSGGPWTVTIRDIPPQSALTVEHRGSFMQIGQAFERLFGWLAVRNLIGPKLRLIGLYHEDPDVVDEADLRAQAGIILEADIAPEPPVSRTALGGGRYAVLRYRGPYADMKAAYLWLFGKWLPQSGEEAADGPVIEEYLNNPRDTAPTDLLTEICLPLRG